MLENFVIALTPWWNTIMILSYLVGMFFIVTGLIALSNVGRVPNMGVSKPSVIAVTSIFAGVALLSLPTLLTELNYTFFGTARNSFLAYTYNAPGSITALAKYAQYRVLAITVIQLIGLIGIIRGVMLFRASSTNPSQLGTACAFTFVGILAINVEKVVRALGVSIGGDIQTTIQKFLN